MTFRDFLLGLLSIGVLSGCPSAPSVRYEAAGLVDVTGTVTMDGWPLADVLVVFETRDGRRSHGETDAEGRYRLQFNTQASGVLPGAKTVRISTAMSTTEEDAAVLKVETIPAKYNTKSELRADVRPDEPQTFDFDLTSGGTVEQPKRETPES